MMEITKPTDGRTREARSARTDERPKRPTAGQEGQLFIPPEFIKPGYVPYLAIDKPGNIERLLRKGWEFIEASSDLGFLRSESATQSGSKYTIPAGGGRLYYGLQIRKEWYDEIQQELTAEARNEKDMQAATENGLPSGAGTYCPNGRTKVLTND
jgi:hypothetical protein